MKDLLALLEIVAPNFKLPATDSRIISLSDYRGSNVVLYFYPKDNTPFCAKEGSNFSNLLEEFQKSNTFILGVSRDTLESHQKFKDKYGYNFPLLSDTKGNVSYSYSVLPKISLTGWSKRATFLIDSNGIIVKVWEHIKISAHASEVLKEVKKLNSTRKKH